MKADRIHISTAEDLVILSWKYSALFFQVFKDKPDPEFYRHLPNLQPSERIVEIESTSAPGLQSELGFEGHLPFFGAIAGGWSCGLTDDPKQASATAALARNHAVLPGSIRKRNGEDELIRLEPPPPWE